MINRKYNAQNVKRFISDDVLKEGYKIYMDQKVNNIRTDDYGYCLGTVKGKRDYEVEVLIKNDQLIEANCDCQALFTCKHVAALLYALSNDGVNINTYKNQNKKVLEKSLKLVDKMDLEESHDFIKNLLRYQRNLAYFKRKYNRYFLDDDISTIKYKLDELFINNVVDNKVVSGKIDDFCGSIRRYVDLSIELIAGGNFAEGFRLYKTLVNDLKSIDKGEVNNYYINLIDKYLLNFFNQGFFKIIYLSEAKVNVFNDFVYHNLDLLFKYLENTKFDNKDKVKSSEYLTGLAKYILQKDSSYADTIDFQEIFYHKLLLMSEVDINKVIEVCETDHTYYKIRILLARMYIRVNKISEAVDILEKGLKEDFNINYIEPLYKMYRSLDVRKYITLLTEAYFVYDKYNIKYYQELKKSAYFDVDKFLAKFPDDLETFPDSYYQILIENKYYDRLLYMLAEKADFEMLKKYNKYLIIDYNEELLNIYNNLLEKEFLQNGQSTKLKNMLEYYKMLPNAKDSYLELVRRFGL